MLLRLFKHFISIIFVTLLLTPKAYCQIKWDSLPAIKSIDTTGMSWGELYVRTTDGIFLREKPSVRSKPICSVPFGEKVKFVDNWEYTFPYDSAEFDLDWSQYIYTPGWVIGYYGGHTGFAFNGYLSRSRTTLYDLNRSPVQLLFEGAQCIGDFAYNPDFYWYGCYLISGKDSQYYVIKPVKLNITTFDGNDWMSTAIIKTDQPVKSKFLFGMEKEMKLPMHVYATFFNLASMIYPGQRLNICPFSNFYATGCADVTNDNYRNVVTDYKLLVQQETKIQDLTKEFDFKAESGYNILSWCGDLNGDNCPDAIFTTGGYHGVSVSLYIGSKYFNDDSSVMKKVSTIKLYGCN